MHILALIEEPDHVCYRHRWHSYRPALAERGWHLEPLVLAHGIGPFLKQLQQINKADVVILQRRLLPWWKLKLLRRAARVLVFDIDDAVFLRDSNANKPAESARRQRRFAATVRSADAVAAGNEFLCQQASQYTDKTRVHYIPTCIQSSSYSAAPHVRRDNDVRLVWIGSRSTMPSLHCARAGLEAAARHLPGLQLKVICDAVPELGSIKVEPCRWSSATEAIELSDADIGICWLPDHPWSLGKCGFKTIQFKAAGLPVVANPFGIHRRLVQHGETGFLATTAHEWADAIQQLAHSPSRRVQMGTAARALIAEHFSIDRWAPSLMALIEQLAATDSPGQTTACSASIPPANRNAAMSGLASSASSE